MHPKIMGQSKRPLYKLIMNVKAGEAFHFLCASTDLTLRSKHFPYHLKFVIVKVKEHF